MAIIPYVEVFERSLKAAWQAESSVHLLYENKYRIDTWSATLGPCRLQFNA